jgi:hypothetical protein
MTDHLMVEIYEAGPQWRRKLRFLMGSKGRLQFHGNLFCSEELAHLLVLTLPKMTDRTVTIADRTGPEVVKFGNQSSGGGS